MINSINKSSDLRLFNLEDIGPHYAKTLAMWEFYLCYCEGGFEERALGDVHMLLVKPENRSSP